MYVLLQDQLVKSLHVYSLFDTNTGTATNWGMSLSHVLSLPLTRDVTLAVELVYNPDSIIIAESTTPISKESYPELFI